MQTDALKTFSFKLNLNIFQFILNLFEIVLKTIHTYTKNMYLDTMEPATLRKNCNQLVAVPMVQLYKVGYPLVINEKIHL